MYFMQCTLILFNCIYADFCMHECEQNYLLNDWRKRLCQNEIVRPKTDATGSSGNGSQIELCSPDEQAEVVLVLCSS